MGSGYTCFYSVCRGDEEFGVLLEKTFFPDSALLDREGVAKLSGGIGCP